MQIKHQVGMEPARWTQDMVWRMVRISGHLSSLTLAHLYKD